MQKAYRQVCRKGMWGDKKRCIRMDRKEVEREVRREIGTEVRSDERKQVGRKVSRDLGN